MGFGAFCPLPLRLGGDNVTGWPAAKQARACADLVAMKRTLPFAWITYTQVGTTVFGISFMAATGLSASLRPSWYCPDTGQAEWTFGSIAAPADPYDNVYPVVIRHAAAGGHHYSSAFRYAQAVCYAASNGFSVYIYDTTGTRADGKVSVALW